MVQQFHSPHCCLPGPLTPIIHNVTAVDTNSVTVQYSAGAGSSQNSFVVIYVKENGQSNEPVCPDLYTCAFDVSVFGIKPGEHFTVKIKATQDTVSSAWASMSGNTKPLPPSAPKLLERSESTLTVRGDAPSTGSSRFDGYRALVNPAIQNDPEIFKTNSGYEIRLQNLTSGTKYTFNAWTYSREEESAHVSDDFYSTPNPPVVINRHTNIATTTEQLSVSWVAPESGSVDGYVVRLYEDEKRDAIASKTSASDKREATFDRLTPGQLYDVSVRSYVNSDVFSASSTAEVSTKPESALNLQLETSTSNTLVVQWEEPSTGSYDEFLVRIQGHGEAQKILNSNQRTYKKEFDNLSAGTEFTMEVITVSHGQHSTATTDKFYTKPERPSNLKKESTTSDSITVKWNAPASSNFDSYRITISSPNQNTEDIAISKSSYTFNGLIPARQYNITLMSLLKSLKSSLVSIKVYTNPAAPTDLRILSRETSSMSFTWSPPANPGKIDSYNYSITVSGATTPEIERSVKINEYSHQLSAGKTYIIEFQMTQGMFKKWSEDKVILKLSLMHHGALMMDLRLHGLKRE
ncbi:hypothetical protein CAPTEDRAFT_214890, partial [Capitella teleta]